MGFLNLDEIARITEAATAGPWDYRPTVLGLPNSTVTAGDGEHVAYLAVLSARPHNAAFIAMARNEMPALIESLRRVADLHRPESTGRAEYIEDENGYIKGCAPTFICTSRCEVTWFFEGGGCETWLALVGEAEAE